jgi:hypothetical protein
MKPSFSSTVSVGLMLDLKVDIFAKNLTEERGERREYKPHRVYWHPAGLCFDACAVIRLGSKIG